MQKIDNWVIEQFDKGTTLLQKKGWLPLNTLIMGAHCLTWVSWIADQGVLSTFSFFSIPYAGFVLYGAFYEWKENVGYWENQRKTQELNARVIWNRGKLKPRLIWAFLLITLGLFVIIGEPFRGIIFFPSALCLLYLRCCRYMGPGDYAKQRQTKISGLPQEGR